MKKIAVTGSTGLVGKKLIQTAIGLGYEITSISRNTKKSLDLFGKNISHVMWDGVNISPELYELFAQCDGIFHLAGASINQSWSNKNKSIITSSRESGTLQIRTALHSINYRGFFFSASAIGYYGDCGDNLVTEQSGVGNDFLAKVCDLWESASGFSNNPFRTVVGRIGIVLSIESGALAETLLPFKLGFGGPLGSGNQWWSWIHINDLVHTLLYFFENNRCSGIYNITAPEPVQMKVFAKTLGKVLHRPSFFKVPAILLKFVLGERAIIVLNSQKIDNSRLIGDGYTFKFNKLNAALQDLLLKL